MATQTKYIGAGTLILSISLLITWFALRDDFKVEISPDIYCMGDCLNPPDSDCIQYFNITSLSKRFYIRNQGNLNLPFTEPEKVASFQVYRADLRFRTDNPNRWKEANLSKGITLQVNQTNEFRLNLCKKNPSDDIKWGLIGLVEADPIFFGINITPIRECSTETKEETKLKYKGSIYYFNQTTCFPTNLSCKKVNYLNTTYKLNDGTYSDFINTTTCEIVGFRDNTRSKSYNCKAKGYTCNQRSGEYIYADSVIDGNGDGIIQSGESYCWYHIPTGKKGCRKDSGSLNEAELD